MLLPSDLIRAQGILTLATVIATDVCVVCDQTYTFIATPASAYDVDVGSDDTVSAANLVLAINATGVGVATTYYETGTLQNAGVTATSAAKVVTLTAKVPGTIGNGIILNSVDATITADAATLGTATAGAGLYTESLESLIDEVQLNSEALSMLVHISSRSSD